MLLLVMVLIPVFAFGDELYDEFISELAFGSARTVQKYIREGVDINQVLEDSGYSPLMIAIKEGNDAAAKLLIKCGADPNIEGKDGNTALTLAAAYDQWRVIKELIASGADIYYRNKDGNALNRAAGFGLKRTVPMLVSAGLNINSTNSRGQTPLAQAAESGHTDTVKYLIKNKAYTHIKDNEGRTAAAAAASRDNLAVVKLLDNKDGSLLVTAARHGSLEVIKHLLKGKPDNLGEALYAASFYNQFRAAELLLTTMMILLS